MRVEVDSEGSEGSWIDVQPGFKVRKEQEPVLITDQVVLRFTVSLSYVHSFVPRATDSEKSDEVTAGTRRSRHGVPAHWRQCSAPMALWLTHVRACRYPRT